MVRPWTGAVRTLTGVPSEPFQHLSWNLHDPFHQEPFYIWMVSCRTRLKKAFCFSLFSNLISLIFNWDLFFYRKFSYRKNSLKKTFSFELFQTVLPWSIYIGLYLEPCLWVRRRTLSHSTCYKQNLLRSFTLETLWYFFTFLLEHLDEETCCISNFHKFSWSKDPLFLQILRVHYVETMKFCVWTGFNV